MIIFASWLCLPRYADSDSDEHPAITCSIVSPNLITFYAPVSHLYL